MSSRIILRSAPVDWVLATMTDLSVLLAALHLGLRDTQGGCRIRGRARSPKFYPSLALLERACRMAPAPPQCDADAAE